MIIKTDKTAVRINGVGSLSLCDNQILRNIGDKIDPIFSFATAALAKSVFRSVLYNLLSDDILYVDIQDSECWGSPNVKERKYAYSYVCFDDMLVRIDDVDRLWLDDDETTVYFAHDSGMECMYLFTSVEDAKFAYDKIVEHIALPGVLLLERVDDELMAYKIV